MSGRNVVAVGGGTGLPRVLTALLALGHDPTAVVTMADDGGSSGRLRRAYGILPPGDVRNCLVALAAPGNELARVFQYRFADGEGVAGHPVGNLVLAALTDLDGGFVAAIDAAAGLLEARGRVLPSTLADVRLCGETADGARIEGQAVVATTPGMARVALEPVDPPAYPPVIDAIDAADAVVIAPGSLFTSIAPNFLVAGVADALRAAADRGVPVVYVCNVANQRGETAGMDCVAHVRTLLEHGLDGALTAVVVHDTERHGGAYHDSVMCGPAERAAIAELGIAAVPADLVAADDPLHHDVVRLAAALAGVIG